jgi:GT2 family glycosyltransferase
LDACAGVIVLNWNGYEDSRACLASLLNISEPKSTIYFVDNASEDESVSKLKSEFGDRIVYLQNDRNLLYAGGNNVGIRRALADGCSSILLLNNDTLVDPLLMHELQKAADDLGDAVYCPKILYANDPSRLWYAGGILKLSRARSAHRGIRELDQGQYDTREETAWATGCALFATRRVFETVGFLDEDFALYSEDLDYCLRARAAGFKIFYVPRAKLWHKVSASVGGNLSRNKLKRKWNSLRRLLKKHIPNPLLRQKALLDFVITEPPRILFMALRGKLR